MKMCESLLYNYAEKINKCATDKEYKDIDSFDQKSIKSILSEEF